MIVFDNGDERYSPIHGQDPVVLTDGWFSHLIVQDLGKFRLRAPLRTLRSKIHDTNR